MAGLSFVESTSTPPPAVSVIIPAYNYATYLGQAIASVLAQEHRDFELIVVDDGSTDHTAEVVAACTDPRLRYLHQSNAGLSAARNTGIREARGEFTAFLDADDEWEPDHLSTTLAHFQRLDPAYALVASTSVRVDPEGRKLPTRLRQTNDREIPVAEIVLKTRFLPSAAVVRRTIFAECGGFDPSLRSSEDRDMWIRLGTRHRIYLQGRTTVRLRKHPANMSKQADRMRQSMRLVIQRARATGVVPQNHYPFWLKAWALFFFQCAWMLHDEGRRTEAIRDACAALVLWPLPIHAAAFNEPPFFRLRALVRFLGLPTATR